VKSVGRVSTASIRKRLLLWTLCVGVGALYGAASGAIGGGLWSLSDQTGTSSILDPALGLGSTGACCGATGGCLAGLIAALCPTRLAWNIAILLGGLPGAFLVVMAICIPETRLAGIVAGSLAAAVCRGLIVGRSRLPGIQRLATLANDTNPRPQGARTHNAPSEPIPATLPRGRGDEAAPASPDVPADSARRGRATQRWRALQVAVLVPLICLLVLHLHNEYRIAHRYVAPVRVGEFATRPASPPLIAAIDEADVASVKRLLDQGVSPNAVDDPKNDENGQSALQHAAATGSGAIVRLLLDRGADINARSFWGGTALISGALSGRPEVVEMLIDRGADVDASDDGTTALDFAVGQIHECRNAEHRRRYREIVMLLKRAGGGSGLWP
jgi:hypothetical protein